MKQLSKNEYWGVLDIKENELMTLTGHNVKLFTLDGARSVLDSIKRIAITPQNYRVIKVRVERIV